MKTSADCKYDISIIIPNYRSKRCLKDSLASIYGKVIPWVSCEIILVNNDEKEDISGIKEEFPDIKIIDHKKNIGFGAANNLGAKTASGRYLFFLNPDCKIISNNIRQIIDEFEADDSVGIIGSQLLEISGKIQKWSAGGEIDFISLIWNNLGMSKDKKTWKIKNPSQVDWVAGTALFARAGLFEEIGGFDENFFMYFEDVDLCKRIRKAGKRVTYFPAYKIFHQGGSSYSSEKIQKKHYYNSQELYFKKNRPKIEYCLIRFFGKMRSIFKA